MPEAPRVWVIESSFTGELNARIGVAERLGLGYERIALPTGDTDTRTYQQTLAKRYQARHPAPLILISGTGEDTIALFADLRPLIGKPLLTIFLASILPDRPHAQLAEYDLIASPQLQLSGPNVLNTTGVAHKITHTQISAAQQAHRHAFNGLKTPVFCLLLGGNTFYCSGFNSDYTRSLAHRIQPLLEQHGGSLLITNSRRTPADTVQALLHELNGSEYRFFDWQNSQSDLYPALLGQADYFISTGDSLSMCSEVCYTGKPLLIDLKKQVTECYHREILGQLIDSGTAQQLTDNFQPWDYTPLDTTGEITTAILQLLGCNN